ncbi:MAG: hypothetical protein IJJ43_06790 [Oscillospiraceae bacterium]|nr:hypothetical protein [Oscillospiraceae bacterium]
MKKTIKLLFADRDRDALQPLLEQLRAKGLRVVELTGGAGKNEVVLAVLSEAFYADGAAVDRLLGLIGAGSENVLPLQLDGAPIPDALKNALYARNIIPTAGRDDAHTAERILSAIPQRKSRLPLLLTAGAVVLAALAGVLIWRSAQNREAAPVMAQEEISVPVSLGLTEEELAEITQVTIVGEYFGYATDEMRANGESSDTVYSAWDSDGPHWYSKVDGTEYSMTRYDDLHFLELMPNLRELIVALVDIDADRLPDLSGAAALRDVWLSDTSIDTLAWLSGSGMTNFMINRTRVTDYGPLSGCVNLREARIDLHGQTKADFSAFSPPRLELLTLANGYELRELDLSALRTCSSLKEVSIDLTDRIEDLSFLSGAPRLTKLTLTNLSDLRDVSALGTIPTLEWLIVESCPELSDLSCLENCKALQAINFLNLDMVTDLSCLADLPNLTSVGLLGIQLRDLNFLKGLSDNGRPLKLSVSAGIRDVSGLAWVKEYESLILECRGHDRADSYAYYQPWLEGAAAQDLLLSNCRDEDLSGLLDVTGTLKLHNCRIRDLSSLPSLQLNELHLINCPVLTSLDGLRDLPAYRMTSHLSVEVVGCPHLTDWSAVEGASLANLGLQGVYSLPEFENVGFGSLRLESIDGLADLSCLDDLQISHSYNSIALVGLDEVEDLSPLRRLKITHLTVPPQLAGQAEELVADGIAGDYEVVYPDGAWQPDNEPIELLSLDELNMLSTPLLRRVESLYIAGGEVYNTEDDMPFDGWDKDLPCLLRYDRETDADIPVDEGPVTDISIFSELAALREFTLCCQPLRTLDGIQSLASLESFRADYCSKLQDVSALFTLQGLTDLSLRATAVDSLQGVQNLYELRHLDISYTDVTDLSELIGLPRLETVTVSADMTNAVASLDGMEYSFELNIV